MVRRMEYCGARTERSCANSIKRQVIVVQYFCSFRTDHRLSINAWTALAGDRYATADNEGVTQILIASGVYNDLHVGLDAQPFGDLCVIRDLEHHFRADANKPSLIVGC